MRSQDPAFDYKKERKKAYRAGVGAGFGAGVYIGFAVGVFVGIGSTIFFSKLNRHTNDLDARAPPSSAYVAPAPLEIVVDKNKSSTDCSTKANEEIKIYGDYKDFCDIELYRSSNREFWPVMVYKEPSSNP